MSAFRSLKMQNSLRLAEFKVARATARALRKVTAEPVRLKMSASDEVTGDYDMHLLREGDRIVYLYNPKSFRRFFATYKYMAAAHIHWFRNTDGAVKRASFDLSDGDWPSTATFAYSTCFSGKVLVPDAHFFRDHGYDALDRVAQTAPAWEDRGDALFWRGQVNNSGLFSTEPAHIDAPWVMQRLRLAMKARDLRDVDVRFVTAEGTRQDAWLEREGLIAPRRDVSAWAGDKFALDVDGYSNAWSNLMQRLTLGCCVLKVASQCDFRQWYYDKLVPFENFVPVKADMSDLAEKVDWVRTHDREAKEIAANGQALARSLTFESETRFAAQAIEDHWEDAF